MAEFSYFDQFGDMQLDLTEYLDQINTDNASAATYTLTNKQPIITTVKNLFSKYDVIFEYKNNIEVILKYEIKDNELMDNVSYNVYGDHNFWWIVALFNDIQNPYKDWPLTQQQIIDLATRMYENEGKFSYDTYVDMIHMQNEEKRNIILPKKQTLKDVIWKYREAILNG